jgi:hypothetical protein
MVVLISIDLRYGLIRRPAVLHPRKEKHPFGAGRVNFALPPVVKFAAGSSAIQKL